MCHQGCLWMVFDETRLKRECVGAVHILCRCQSPGKIRLTVWQEWFLSLPIVQELPSQSEMVLPDPDQKWTRCFV